MEQGQLERAAGLLVRSRDERKALYGGQHPELADSLVRLSAIQHARGDWPGALASAQDALRIYRATLGDDERTAAALAAASRARFSAGAFEQAVTLRRNALAMRRRVHGPVHANVADDLRALAALLAERERFDEAAPLFTQALAIDSSLYGDHSVRYASTLDTQANMLLAQGNTLAAADAYERAASIYRSAGDAGNLEDALNHSGVALCRLGRFAQAQARMRESLALVEREQPPGSQWIATRKVSLGNCLTLAGQFAAAEPLLAEGFDAMQRSLGPRHAWTAYALREYADNLAQQGKVDAARMLAMRMRAQLGDTQAPDAVHAEDLRVLGVIEYATGETAQGLRHARDAVALLRARHGDAYPRTAAARLSLARLELADGRTNVAINLLDSAMPVFAGTHDRPRALQSRLLQGAALAVLGRCDEAQPMLQRAVAEALAMYGQGNPRTTQALRQQAACASKITRGQ